MNNNYFASGQWNVICDVCGKRFKIREMQKRWDGLLVCSKDFELDHPQKFLRVRETGQAVPIIRDEPQDTFVPFICYLYASYAYADLAEADCGRADINSPFTYQQLLDLKGRIPSL